MTGLPSYGHGILEIVVIEDDPNDVAFIMHAIKASNISTQIHVLEDGQEAVDFIYGEGAYDGKEPVLPKVILLDLKLPKLNGLDILKRLKSDSTTSHIPVVMLTSSSEDSDVVEAYKLGANSYIVKPVDFQKFINAITAIGNYWLSVNYRPKIHVEGE